MAQFAAVPSTPCCLLVTKAECDLASSLNLPYPCSSIQLLHLLTSPAWPLQPSEFEDPAMTSDSLGTELEEALFP